MRISVNIDHPARRLTWGDYFQFHASITAFNLRVKVFLCSQFTS
jgi:hypothetical protein